MEDKLRKYVDDIFNGTVLTRKAVELKEEMIQNLQDKFNDLINEGKSPEAAYNIAIAGIGDVRSLLKELESDDQIWGMAEQEMANRKSAMFTAVAVMTYILCVLPLIILNQLEFRYAANIGIPIMFVLAAFATGLLVYNSMTKPRKFKSSDTIVEEFREWQSDNHQRKSLRRSISSALWSLLTVLYFIISFSTSAWHVTWIAFLIGAALEAFINIFFSMRKWGS